MKDYQKLAQEFIDWDCPAIADLIMFLATRKDNKSAVLLIDFERLAENIKEEI